MIASKFSKIVALGFAAALALFVTVLPATGALAHDVLVDVDPKDGAVLDEAPATISITFNNKLIDIGTGATVMNVLDAQGNLVIDAEPVISGMSATQATGDLPAGAYRLVWRVVSSDGHPITGTSTFAFGPDAKAALAALPGLDEVGGGSTAKDGTETLEGDATGAPADTPAGTAQLLPTPAIIAIAVAALAAVVLVMLLMIKKTNPPKK